MKELTAPLAEIGSGVVEGMNLTADSFYSSQGKNQSLSLSLSFSGEPVTLSLCIRPVPKAAS